MDLRFEIGVPDYPLDHNGEVQAVAIRGEKGRDLGLRRVPLDEMLAQREALPAMRAVPTAGSVGTGFSLKHAAAGAADYAFWKVLGWKTGSQSMA